MCMGQASIGLLEVESDPKVQNSESEGGWGSNGGRKGESNAKMKPGESRRKRS